MLSKKVKEGNFKMNMMTLLNATTGTGTTNSAMSWIVMIAYIAIFGLGIYFLIVKPQKKEQEKHKAVLASMEIGDSVLTTAGFYGTLIDIQDDTVIVEFGNNKNCRIPMQKNAVVEVEKANAE